MVLWELKRYLFAKLAEKNGVTLRIYHRLVEPMEQRKIIQSSQSALQKFFVDTSTSTHTDFLFYPKNAKPERTSGGRPPQLRAEKGHRLPEGEKRDRCGGGMFGCLRPKERHSPHQKHLDKQAGRRIELSRLPHIAFGSGYRGGCSATCPVRARSSCLR